MSRRCAVTSKGPMSGNNVSHANNRTRRRFLPSVKKIDLYSEVLGRSFTVRISNAGLRTLEHKGGFDAYIASTGPTKLDACLRTVKTQITKAMAAKAV
ncbi:MAG: 50S ribosomal protein L28 [Alphaproteobacteria bacterium]